MLLLWIICQSGGTWVDLSHAFDAETIYWPTAASFVLEDVFVGETEKGYHYEAKHFSADEHGGTHLDAPIHFFKGAHSVDQIPVEQLVGPAIVIDVRSACRQNRDYQVGVSDFLGWESVHGPIPEGAIVLLNTGFAAFWPDRIRYMGTDKRGPEAVAELHFPGLDPAAARWIVDTRKIRLIGLDTPSIDYGQSTLFESHRILFEHNIPALENVGDLSALPPKGAQVYALPMKIGSGSGAPVRIIASLP
ncbi:MAG: cyclase family protein [Acidobacteria bacterium]|nr:cyclase family protein [Acidobacteriota bacterium]MCB9398905.1 cyclase family protein [Acidobacteriota bacterium]